jgi:hypothetical protein
MNRDISCTGLGLTPAKNVDKKIGSLIIMIQGTFPAVPRLVTAEFQKSRSTLAVSRSRFGVKYQGA